MPVIERDRLLLLGAPGAGKSQAVVDLALALPNIVVYALDMQDSIQPLLSTMTRLHEPTPDNLDLRRIGGAPLDAWAEFDETLNSADGIFANVNFGDWICFDVAADWWQLAQDAHVESLYALNTAEFKETKIREVKASNKPNRKALGFGGLEKEDWDVIKPKYGRTIPRALSTRCFANVLVTANEKTPAHWMRGDEMVFLEANLPGQYKKEMVKPHGEAQLTSQVDVVLWLKHPNDKKWTLSTIGKGRYRLELRDEDVTGTTVWNTFCMALGRDPEKSPGKGE